MADISWQVLAVTISAACVAAVTDVWKFRVYNALTIPLVLTGLLYHGVTNGLGGLADSSLGLLFGFGVLLLPYLLGLIGAGDVKLMAGVGAWLCLSATAIVFAASALVAGVYAFVLILCRGKLGESWLTIKLILYRFVALGIHLGKQDLVEPLTRTSDRRLRLIPFGAMVPPGIVAALLWTQWIQ
ncbi:MAG: prepilin peptidase [Planctomycetes bacterium]|nr:prepilin peptidase [Planctomycetota bacterium]